MSLNADSVPHKQLHHMVAEKIRAAIVNGAIKPGEWLRQRRIADELGVSQMPVREALRELAAEGLIEHIPYRGMRVIEFSHEDVADLYAQRSCLESRAARSAAERVSEQELERMRVLLKEMESNLESENLQEYRRLNRLFHQTVYQASRRGYLVRTLDQLWSAFPTMLWGKFQFTEHSTLPERDSTDLMEHQDIIEALASRDPDQAESVTRDHIEAAGRQLILALRARR